MPGDGDLDDPLEGLSPIPRLALPDRLQDLVHLEEQPLVPEGGGVDDRASDRVAGRRCGTPPVGRGRLQGPGGMQANRGIPGCVHVEQPLAAGVDEVDGCQTPFRIGRRRTAASRQPLDGCTRVVGLERLACKRRECVTER
jgi:hypothetical protein